MRTTLIFTFVFKSLEKMIAWVIFFIVFRFLRYSLAPLNLILPLKLPSIRSRELLSKSEIDKYV